MKLNHQSEKYSAKKYTNQTLNCNVPKIIVVVICKQSLRHLEKGILLPEEQKWCNSVTTIQK